MKTSNSFLANGENIRQPATCYGKEVYEGEFGIVILKTCGNVSEVDAAAQIFGYTCINDVTAAEQFQADATFDQWTRGQGFVTLGVFWPVVRW